MAIIPKQESRIIPKEHESRPIRAGIASLLNDLPETALSIGAGVKTILQYPFKAPFGKTFSEIYDDTSEAKASKQITNFIYDTVGANRRENQDKSERTASFVGEMIPSIATISTKGLIAAPKSLVKAATSSSRKAAKQTFRNVAKGMMDKATTKEGRMLALHEANRGSQVQKFLKDGVKGPIYNPILGEAREKALKVGEKGRFAREMLLPGIQVETESHLIPKYLKPGVVNTLEDINKAKKAVRLEQGMQLGGQLGFNLGIEEAIAALNDSEGLIGDYTETNEHLLRKNESNWLLPSALLGTVLFGMHFGNKKLQQLYGTEYKDLVSGYKAAQTEHNLNYKHYENLPTIKQTENSIATNLYDSTAFLDDGRFSYMFTPTDKANMRYDTTTSINSIMATGYPNISGANIKPVELYNNLSDLNKFHPQEWKNLEDYLDTNNKIASYINDYNLRTQGPDNYTKFTYMDDINLPQPLKSDPILQDLRKQSKKLRKIVEANPVTKKLLDDIFLDSKIRLKLATDSGRLSQEQGQYLLKNYTVDGYYSYKPFIEQMPDKNVLDNAKDFAFAKELDENLYQFGRTARNLDRVAKSYTDTYLGAVMSDLKYAQKNSRIKAMINAGFPNEYTELTKLSKDLKSTQEMISAIDERINRYGDPLGKLERARKFKKDEFEKLQRRALNITHIEFIGEKHHKNYKVFKLATNPYDYLNRVTKIQHPDLPYVRPNKHLPKDIVDQIQNYRTSKDIIMFTNNEGDQLYFRVNPLLKQAVDMSPDLPNAFGLAMLGLKRTKQEFTTGALNPIFAPTSAIFGLQENLAALPRILGREVKAKDYFEAAKFNGLAVKMQVARDIKQNIVNEWKSEWIRTMGDMSQSPMSKKYTEDMISKMEVDIEDCLLTKFERAGAVAYRYPEGLKNTQYPLSMDMNLTQKMKRNLYNVWGAKKAIKCGQYIDYCTEALRNASTVGALLHLNAINKLKNNKEFRTAVDLISKNITDTKKSGIHVGAVGNSLGFVGKYIPYGRVGINSIGAKLEAMHAGDGITFLKAAKRQIKNANYSWGEVAHMVQLGATGLLGNQYLQSLYYTALIPTLGCYLWNHLSQENKQDYYTLSDYNKASKLTLANFYGKGKHLTVPLDQEIGVACKLYETMLDSILNLSKDNGVDPAFQNSRLLGIAMARSFNLEDMVVPEVLLNSAGMTSNFDIGSGGSMINKLPMNQTNLDGSQTALQNGIMSQESHAIINTIFGAVGKTLANGAEQFHIGARDVGIGQGLKDFVSSTLQKDIRPIPFMPNSMMGARAMTQTAQQVKGKIDTIDKLRKLNTFNSTNPSLVGKKGAKVLSDALRPTLDPKLQFASQVAQVAVPYYNDKIKPIYDQVSGIYKQIATYNATGRDSTGNIIGTMDRWKYQQNKIKQVQQIYKQLYFEFEKLENILTNQFKRDINLTEFNNLQ